MNKFVLTTALIASMSLAACANGQMGGIGGMGTKQTVGAAGGAVLGGLAGSQIGDGKGRLIATGVGTLAGLFLGSEIGKSLDRADMAYANRAATTAHTAPIGQQISWNNPESGNYGYVTPVNDGYTQSGQYCREYKQTIYVDGRQETGYGTACKQSDGTWQIVT